MLCVKRLIGIVVFVLAGKGLSLAQSPFNYEQAVWETLMPIVREKAKWAMKQEPETVTSTVCERSAGGRHDFYSEGDYWWPDPENPNGPYIQKDGQTNPDNFVAHRHAMIRFSEVVGALTSAYLITHNKRYVEQVFKHAKSWFVDTATLMNPSLLYAQAIKGRVTGRGIGIIDTIHLMEVAQGIYVLQNVPGADKNLVESIKQWFEGYLKWLTTHEYGFAEMNAENNHGTCWVMQVASFARLTGNHEILNMCRDRYKNILLPNQMAAEGSFPRELRRTKPYGYSLFNLDAMTMVCQILSIQDNDLWNYSIGESRNILKGIEFMFPFVADKSKWSLNKDVMYWDQWPVAHPFLIFGAAQFDNQHWFTIWKKLNHDPKENEVIRNLPIRNPLIWMEMKVR
jgi:hypothetical protein